jgi:hypothetical protein
MQIPFFLDLDLEYLNPKWLSEFQPPKDLKKIKMPSTLISLLNS